jgi:hypothetical protein
MNSNLQMQPPTQVVVSDVWFKRSTASEERDALFVFGDNLLHIGRRGQAVVRGLPNAHGIPTKHAPGRLPADYFTDAALGVNRAQMRLAIELLVVKARKFRRVVLPADGLGTGLAELEKRAPKTYALLKAMLRHALERIEPGSSARWRFLAQ